MLSHFSCLTLCDPLDCIPPGSSVYGILQARRLEWVAMLSSRGSPQPRDRTLISSLQGNSLPLSHQGKPKVCPVVAKIWLFLKILLKFTWFTIVFISAALQIWLRYMYIFFYISFHLVYYKIFNKLPVWFSRTLLFIHLISNSLHLLIPNSQSIPTPPPAMATTSLFSRSVSLFLFHRYVHLCHILDSTDNWYYRVFVFLFLTFFA